MNTCCDGVTTTAGTRVERVEDAHRTVRPALDVIETKEAYRLRVDVPGAGREDVELGLEKGILSITARVPSREGSPERYHVHEHAPRTFVRRVRVGETIDAGGVTAEVARGVLTVHLPKVPAAKPRRIEVG